MEPARPLLALLLATWALSGGAAAEPVGAESSFGAHDGSWRGSAFACPLSNEECDPEGDGAQANVSWEARAGPHGTTYDVRETICVRIPLLLAIHMPSESLPEGAWDAERVTVCVRDGSVSFNDCFLLA